MRKYYVTGVPGIGKTTVMHALIKKGTKAFDLDYIPGICEWVNKESKEPVQFLHGADEIWHKQHGWFCNVERLKEFIGNQTADIVICGICENQDDFLFLFDKIFLLRADRDIFMNRMAGRNSDHFGYHEDDRKTVLNWYESFEENLLKRGAVPIDASQDIEDIANSILL